MLESHVAVPGTSPNYYRTLTTAEVTHETSQTFLKTLSLVNKMYTIQEQTFGAWTCVKRVAFRDERCTGMTHLTSATDRGLWDPLLL